jgi:hypothetical protein
LDRPEYAAMPKAVTAENLAKTPPMISIPDGKPRKPRLK